MDLTNSASSSMLQTVKERMREKINLTLKAVKLQTSLAAKIKSKNLNNSSAVKISLKHNNRALACALTAEKEKARSLESDKMILQKEVKMLHFQNALLRQNLSIVNRMLKDIDLFMNVNLPAAIEISSISESSDLLATEERKSECFSHESRLSVDECQGFRLTGVALRVPSSSVEEQQKRSSVPTVALNKDEHLLAPQATDSSTSKEKSDEQHESEMRTSFLTAEERYATCKNMNRDSSLNMKVPSVLPLDEDVVSNNRSGGFVTRRRKRSTASFSSTQSMNSDFNHSKSSLGNAHWEHDKHENLLPQKGHSSVVGEYDLHFDFLIGKDMLPEMSCSPLSINPEKNCAAMKVNKDIQLDTGIAHQPDLVYSGECDVHPIDRPVEQEKTVYEADMEMTSSDSATIVAVIPKRNLKTTKSSIPVKQVGASLRKVKTTAHEKTKKSSSCKGKESSMPSKSKETEITLNIGENLPFEFKPPADLTPDLINNYDSRRTFVLPGPMEDKTKVYESDKPYPDENKAEPSVVGSTEESVAEDIDENVPLKIKPAADFRPGSTDRYDIRRTYVLPGPVKKSNTKILESETKPNPAKNNTEPPVSSTLQSTFTETNYLCDFNSDLNFVVEHLPGSDVEHKTNTIVKKRKSKCGKGPSKVKENSKKKRKLTANLKDLEHLGEEQESQKGSELKNVNINDTIPSLHMENQDSHIRRETYVLSSNMLNFALSDFVPKDNGNNYRRETFVIPESNRLIPFSEEIDETLDHPLKFLKSAASKDAQLVMEDVTGTKKNPDSNIVSNGLDTDFNKPHGFRKSKCKEINQNKRSSNLFSQVDKRKTRILTTNQSNFSNDTLVRDSCVNATQCRSIKPTQFINAVMANEEDSFILDMVSESILDGTLDCPSLLEFPSTTNHETAFMDNVSFSNVPLLDPPMSDKCTTKEDEQINASKSSDVLDENDNGLAQEIFEEQSNQCCKIENQSMEISEADAKPFQDLTNKTPNPTKQSTKSCAEDSEEAQVHTRRRRNPVNYKEPSLGTKLRRGDTPTNNESLNSPTPKGKGKKGGGRKKKIKSEQ